MAAIRTPLQLADAIDGDKSWRSKELQSLYMQYKSARRGHLEKLLRRAGVALLYAHWEGFVKVAASKYIEFVSKQGLAYKDLTPPFLALGAKHYVDTIAESSKGAQLCRVAQFFVGPDMGQKAKLFSEKAVSTKSNLNIDVFKDIVAILGLDYSAFEVHEKTVIGLLVEQRNRIAHGEYLLVDHGEYERLHKRVLEMMDEFGTQIVDGAFNQSFRIAPIT